MSYALVVTPVAEAKLVALPASLAQFVRQQLQQLIENPGALSQPTSILQPRGQLFGISRSELIAKGIRSILIAG